jgi:hypothetical protein
MMLVKRYNDVVAAGELLDSLHGDDVGSTATQSTEPNNLTDNPPWNH